LTRTRESLLFRAVIVILISIAIYHNSTTVNPSGNPQGFRRYTPNSMMLHITAYMTLAFFTQFMLSDPTIAFALTFSQGASIELIQYMYIPTRFGTYGDVILNGIGAMVGVTFYTIMRFAYHKLVESEEEMMWNLFA
jgi:VanZ family protein